MSAAFLGFTLPSRARIFGWFRVLSVYLVAQGATQALSLATGLLLVRTLDRQVFAFYAIAASVLTFLASTTDLGITSSLLHFFRRTLAGEESFEGYVAAVTSIRKWAIGLGAPIAVVAIFLLDKDRAFPAELALGSGLFVVAGTWAQMHAAIRLMLLRLDGRVGRSYRAELTGSLVRLGLSAATVATRGFLGLAAAPAAIVASVAGSIATSWQARRPREAPPTDLALHKADVLRYLLPTLPSGLYFSIQGPILLWLAATFGNVSLIADIGALSRLGLIVSVLSPLPSVLLLPRLARIADDRTYWRRALQFGIGYAALFAIPVVVAWRSPQVFLWLLGRQYADLGSTLALCMTSTSVSVFTGFAVGLTRARGWTRWDTPALVVLVCAQVVAVAIFPLDRVSGVLYFGLTTGLMGLLTQIAILLAGRSNPSLVSFDSGHAPRARR